MPDEPAAAPKIGLALSGGGVRGLAHIGVLKALERAGLRVHALAGTSMGGFVGAAYACGLSPDELEIEADHFSRRRYLSPFVDRAFPRRGLLEGNRLMDYFCRRVGDLTFAETRLALALVAVDLNSGQVVTLDQGSVVQAVRATIALPGLFSPVERGDQLLVDGGLLANLPSAAVRALGADLVIGVDVGSDAHTLAQWHQDWLGSRFLPDSVVDLIHILLRSLMIMTQEANRYYAEQDPPELTIRPVLPPGITLLSGFERAAEIIRAGEQAAQAALPELATILSC